MARVQLTLDCSRATFSGPEWHQLLAPVKEVLSTIRDHPASPCVDQIDLNCRSGDEKSGPCQDFILECARQLRTTSLSPRLGIALTEIQPTTVTAVLQLFQSTCTRLKLYSSLDLPMLDLVACSTLHLIDRRQGTSGQARLSSFLRGLPKLQFLDVEAYALSSRHASDETDVAVIPEPTVNQWPDLLIIRWKGPGLDEWLLPSRQWSSLMEIGWSPGYSRERGWDLDSLVKILETAPRLGKIAIDSIDRGWVEWDLHEGRLADQAWLRTYVRLQSEAEKRNIHVGPSSHNYLHTGH